MNKLRKIPLEPFIEILQQLFEEGADFIDITSEDSINNKDVVKITVKPEYFLDKTRVSDDDVQEERDITNYYEKKESSKSLSEDDINDLI